MTTVDEISSVLAQIDVLVEAMHNSRNAVERGELNRDIDTLCDRLAGLRDQLKQESYPCQTPGCDKPAELESNRCVHCADGEVEHGN